MGQGILVHIGSCLTHEQLERQNKALHLEGVQHILYYETIYDALAALEELPAEDKKSICGFFLEDPEFAILSPSPDGDTRIRELFGENHTALPKQGEARAIFLAGRIKKAFGVGNAPPIILGTNADSVADQPQPNIDRCVLLGSSPLSSDSNWVKGLLQVFDKVNRERQGQRA